MSVSVQRKRRRKWGENTVAHAKFIKLRGSSLFFQAAHRLRFDISHEGLTTFNWTRFPTKKRGLKSKDVFFTFSILFTSCTTSYLQQQSVEYYSISFYFSVTLAFFGEF